VLKIEFEMFPYLSFAALSEQVALVLVCMTHLKFVAVKSKYDQVEYQCNECTAPDVWCAPAWAIMQETEAAWCEGTGVCCVKEKPHSTKLCRRRRLRCEKIYKNIKCARTSPVKSQVAITRSARDAAIMLMRSNWATVPIYAVDDLDE
jgi:hypothetical protein